MTLDHAIKVRILASQPVPPLLPHRRLRPRTRVAVAIACLAVVGLARCTNPRGGQAASVEPIIAVEPDARFSALRNELKGMVQSGELVSLAVGAVAGGRIVWAEAWGWADREAGAPATTETRYGIASLGKSVTATALMSLVEAGKIDLDAEVPRILGAGALRLLAADRGPTVRQLLNMTAGIPHGALTYTTGPAPSEAELMRERSIVVFEPGTTFHYSNFSIAVADEIIEKVAGRPFGEAVRARVFAPLGMSGSSVGPDPGLPTPAARYASDGTRFPPLLALPRSSRQMLSSLADMLRYAAFGLKTPFRGQRKPVSDRTLDAMHNELSGLENAHVALGWGHLDLGGGRRWIISSGNDMGVQSSLSLLPEEAAGVIVLTNTSGGQADEIGIRIADILRPGFLGSAMAAIEAHQARTRPFVPEPPWIGEWEGTVRAKNGPLPISLTISAEDGVSVEFDHGPRRTLEEALISGGLLTGVFEGRLTLEEPPEGAHRIELGLRCGRPEALTGFAVANFRSARGKFEIPTFAELRRKKG